MPQFYGRPAIPFFFFLLRCSSGVCVSESAPALIPGVKGGGGALRRKGIPPSSEQYFHFLSRSPALSLRGSPPPAHILSLGAKRPYIAAKSRRPIAFVPIPGHLPLLKELTTKARFFLGVVGLLGSPLDSSVSGRGCASSTPLRGALIFLGSRVRATLVCLCLCAHCDCRRMGERDDL